MSKNETFVKENHHPKREHTTAFTQNVSNPNVVLPLEFLFKGTNKLSLPNGVKYNWAPKGSYPQEQFLELVTILMPGGNKRSYKLKQIYS